MRWSIRCRAPVRADQRTPARMAYGTGGEPTRSMSVEIGTATAEDVGSWRVAAATFS